MTPKTIEMIPGEKDKNSEFFIASLTIWNLKHVSSLVDLSPEYAGKIFKEAQGLSVSQYINKVRLSKAGKLLNSTELTVKEICNQVGIENDQYFYRLFKKEYGTTPAQYRVGGWQVQ